MPTQTDPAGIVYAFAAWLTTRAEAITAGAGHDAAPMAELCRTFCAVNDFPPPPDDAHAWGVTMPSDTETLAENRHAAWPDA